MMRARQQTREYGGGRFLTFWPTLILLLALPATAQVPDVYAGNLDTEHRTAAWRSFDDLLASGDEVAQETIEYFDRLVKMKRESDSNCLVLELPGTDPTEPLEFRESMRSAMAKAKHAGLATVVSTKPGRGPGTFGTLLELHIEENFKQPFLKSEDSRRLEKGSPNATTIYYLYHAWEYEYKGVNLCVADSKVPARVPEPGERMIVFTPPYEQEMPPYFFSSIMLPVIAESRENTLRTNALGSSRTSELVDTPLAEVAELLRGMRTDG